MKTHRNVIMICLAASLAGCAGRAEVRHVAAQSATILSQTQAQVVLFNTSQTRLNNVIQNNIAIFNTMTTETDRAVKTSQTTWLDPKMKAIFQEVKSADAATYIAAVNDVTSTTPRGPAVNVGTAKIRAAVAKLNALAKAPSLKSQVTFLVEFAKGVKSAFDEQQKKATDFTNGAAAKAKALSPGVGQTTLTQ